MQTDLRTANRTPFDAGPLASGAAFEQAVLADGRRVILKHLPADGDWLTRFTNGIGRARHLWESGLLDQIGRCVDHGVLDVVREDEHDVLVMEDVSSYLLPRGVRLPVSAVDGVLGGLASLHRSMEGSDLRDLCAPSDRHRIASRSFHSADAGPHPNPFKKIMLRGWERFAERVPDDVADAVFAVHDDPAPLGQKLQAATASTLLHGDAKLGNLGRRDGRSLLIDWGELTGWGPAEMDLTWFAATSTTPGPGAPTWSVDAMPDDLFLRYEELGGRVDPEALDLACIGQLAQQGFVLAAFAAFDADSTTGERCSRLLEWWVERVGTALERWSPA